MCFKFGYPPTVMIELVERLCTIEQFACAEAELQWQGDNSYLIELDRYDCRVLWRPKSAPTVGTRFRERIDR